MRRLASYIYDLILLNYGVYLRYRLRQVIEWLKLMEKEIEEHDKSEHDIYEIKNK